MLKLLRRTDDLPAPAGPDPDLFARWAVAAKAERRRDARERRQRRRAARKAPDVYTWGWPGDGAA